MANEFKISNNKAVIYWPIGTGDSTTLIVKPAEIFIQIDLHHLEKADKPEEPEWPIIDHLIKVLPKKNEKPYLSLFILTHPDKDHIQGFKELLNKVQIGEIWHTPKIFRDQSDEESLCEDAKAFRKEVHRRRKIILDNPSNISSGNKLRIIGHDDILTENNYKELPEICKSRPGNQVRVIDGIDLSSEFCAFIHAPFSEDQAKDKNNTSLSLNIAIWEGDKCGQFFFFGDREYLTTKQIFCITEQNNTNIPYLYWDVLLCPHHCSKAVMYYQDVQDKDVVYKDDVMEYFEKYARENTGYIISSSHSDFTDGEGDNPPHKKARTCYEKIVKAGRFLCTHEYPNKTSPEPLVFNITSEGVKFLDNREKGKGPSGLASAVSTARGGTEPPKIQQGFGN